MDRAYILRDDAGRPYRMLGSMMDITERKQIEEIIRNQNDMLSSLYQITLDLLKYRDIDALLAAMVELSAKFLDATFSEIMLMEGEVLVVKAAAKNQSSLVGQRMSREDAMLSWQAVDSRQHVVLEDYNNWSLRGTAYDDQILHAVVVYPILNDAECLGVLGLGRDKPGYEFTTDQIQFGNLLANLTALILNNAQLREALREQSIHDPLTGLFNRRYMEDVLKQHLSRVTRQHHPLGMIMVDIDHFKRFNDAHGHAAGDALLREVGRLLQNQIRVEDVACRYGGEEFLLIMPGASIAETWDRAGKLRREVKELQIEHEGRMIGEITLSAGVAVYPEHGSTQDSLMRAADAALYRAKQGGRDQAFLAESRK
jgi:diguanylate cyclase (GGDEF)-like protein